MDSKFIKPSLFCADPNSREASKDWKHWYRTFTKFLNSLPAETAVTDLQKLSCLIAHIDKDEYDNVSKCETYEAAIETLQQLYVKPSNVIFARHELMTLKQQPEQPLNSYLQKLRQLAKECGYRNITPEVCRDQAIRNAFIAGLVSTTIRSRLLENTTQEITTLDTIYNHARFLDVVQRNSERYNVASQSSDSIASHFVETKLCTMNSTLVEKIPSETIDPEISDDHTCAMSYLKKRCGFCGSTENHTTI